MELLNVLSQVQGPKFFQGLLHSASTSQRIKANAFFCPEE